MTRCAPIVALLAFISILGISPGSASAGPPAQLGFDPDTPTVTAGDFQQFKLLVLDDVGVRTPTTQARTINLFAGAGSFYTSASLGSLTSSVNISSGADSVIFYYRGTLASGGSPHALNALSGDGLSPFLGGTGYVNVIPAAVSASVSTITADSPVPADGTSGGVTVTSKDPYGNPREGDTVVLSAGGGTTVTQPGGPTNTSGVASGTVSNTSVGNVVVSATAAGTPLSTTADVLFTAGGPSASTSTVSATSPVVANGVAASTVTITVKDANNNPVGGQTVTLAISPPGNGAVIGQPAGVTNAGGVITGTLTSTTTGDRVVTATVGGSVVVTQTATVSFIPGPIASFDVIVDGASTAGVFDPFTLTARDAQGNVKTDYTGTVNLSTTSADTRVDWGAQVAINSPSNGAGDAATFLFDPADNGSVTLLAQNLFAETYQLNVADGGATGQSGDLVNSPASASQIDIVTGTGQIAAVATTVATRPKVRVRDAYDNPVSGATVTFGPRTATSTVEVTSGGAADDSTGTTDGNGELDCDEWTLAQTAGANTLRAYLGAGTPFVDFDATGEPGVGASLVITPNGAQNVTVGASPVVTLTLRDQFDNLVSGERVDVFISDALDGSLAANAGSPTNALGAGARWGNTNASGQISVVYQAPGSAALSDVIDGSTSQVGSASVTNLVYTTTGSGGTNLRITFVGPTTVTAGTTFEFLVEAVDGGGNVDTGNNSVITLTPEGGSTLVFSESDFGATVTQVTLSGGAATVYGRGTKAGAWDIQVSGGGLTSDTDEITIEDTNVIDHYAVTTVDSVVAGVSFNVAIQARDVYDNLVDGASNTVNLAAVEAAGPALASDVLSVTQTTLVSGQANLGEQYTVAETIRVRARDGGNKEGFSTPVKVKPAAADRIFIVSGNATVTAGAQQALTVVVRDQFNNAVAGVNVNFAATAGGGSIPSPVATGANGQASSTLTTGTTVATNNVAATILGGNPPDERVDFTVQTVAGPVASYVVTPSATTVLAGVSLGVTVTAKDVNSNTRVLDSSTIVALSSDGDMQFTAASGALTAGVFSTTMFDQTAENVVVTAQTQGGGPSGSTPTITVNPAGAGEIVKISGDAAGLPVGARQTLVVEVRDSFGNPVLAGTSITFQVTSSPGPAQFRDAVGDTTDGITTTNAAGRGTVELLTASTAGTHTVKATILDGNPPATETRTFTVSTVASGIAYYTVELGATQQTAGVPVGVTVRAFDSLDNPVVSDNTTQVDLSLATGVGTPVFGSDPGTLTGGVFQTTVTLTLAEAVTVRAQTLGSPGINGVSPTLTIVPGPPGGTMTGTAVPSTITATGLTTSTITSGVVRDQFANPVAEGEMITVAETNARVTFDSDDQDGVTPGLQRRVGAAGTFTVVVRSKTSAGPESITFASVNGSATGAVALTLAPAPTFATTTPPSPSVVYVGETVQFSANVTNTSTTGVTLSGATNFTFSDGTHVYSANLVTPTPIAGSATTGLTFASAVVSINQSPTYYAPTINLIGTDQYGAFFSRSSQLPAQSLLVSALQITAIAAPPLVSRGTTDTVTVTINNPTTSDVTITSVLPRFSGSGNFTPLPGIGLPRLLAQTSSAVVKVPVAIGAGTPTGPYTINATVTGDIDGNSVVDDDVAPFPTASWTVQEGASLSYVGGSLTPDMVTLGKDYAFSVDIHNDGQATVTLNALTTRLEFTDGVDTYSATLTQAAAIAGSMTQTIPFAMQTVPVGMADSTYDVSLYLDGTENGVPFAATLVTSDQVAVETPAVVVEAVPNSLSPDQVSRRQSVQLKVNLTNTGGASVVLDPATTRITFGVSYTAYLAAGVTTLDPGTQQLTFETNVVPEGIGLGSYNPSVHLQGTENGQPFVDDILLVDSIEVLAPPSFAIVDIIPSQAKFTQNQSSTIKVRMVVQNNGGAAVDFDVASLSFKLGGTSTTSQFNRTVPTGFQINGATLPGGGAVDTLLFTVGDAAGPMSTGLMTIEGSVTVIDQNTSQPVTTDPGSSGQGELLVQTPGVLQFVDLIASQTTVTQNMVKNVSMDLVVHNGGQSDLQLTLSDPGARLVFDTPGWAWNVDGALAGGGDILAGAATDTISFTITTSGSATGPTSVSAAVNAVEINSNTARNEGPTALETLTVQTPAVFAVTDVSASRATLTDGSDVLWTLTIDVANTGGADLQLLLPASFKLTFQDIDVDPAYTPPTILDGDGTILPGSTSGTLTVPLTGTGTYLSLGDKVVTAELVAREINTGIDTLGDDTTVVTIQATPVPGYVNASLSPAIVSLGTDVGFNLSVSNFGTGAATVDVTSATLAFDSPNFSAALSPGTYTIAAGATGVLQFVDETIPTLATPGPQGDVTLTLNWSDNGRQHTDVFPIPALDLVVQDAPELSIQAIIPSRQQVTATVEAPWKIRMVVANGGATDVEIDPRVANTYLTLRTLAGTPVTGQYSIQQPTTLQLAGDFILGGGDTDTLVFDVTSTGTTTGTIVTSGRVEGRNVLSSDILSDVSQGGSFAVQLPADIAILAIVPDRNTATVLQTTPYQIMMAVRNNGQATATVNLDPDSTFVTFDPPTGWNVTVEPQLAEGDTELLGGETDSVVVTVNTTGSPAGLTNIGGRVAVRENNTGAIVDKTVPSGFGTITLQDAATVVADSVTPSRAFITEGSSADWSIRLDLTNTGTANAQLILPTGVSLSIQDATGGTTIGTVNGLVEGGTTVPGTLSRALIIPVTDTGSFASLGLKSATAKVRYIDVNSGVVDSVVAVFPITVQSAPNLQYVGGTLDPPVASSGKVVGFNVDVTNVGENAATARLTPGQTRFSFDGNNYSAFLDPTSVDSLTANQTVTLKFEDKVLSSGAGAYDAALNLFYSFNGQSTSRLRNIVGDLTVEAPPELAIIAMQVSQSTVNALMTKEWTVSMSVMNNGNNSVDIDLSSAVTNIVFNKAGVVDPLPGYVVLQPTEIEGTGGIRLGVGAQGNLVFRVVSTGPDTGEITINGVVEGQDVGSSDRPSDNTFDGGAGAVTVQTAVDLVTSLAITSPPGAQDGSVSINQQFVVTATVANNGTAAIDGPAQLTLTLPPGFTLPNTDPVRSFSVGQQIAWTVQAPDAPQAAEPLTASISTVPDDKNTGEPAQSSVPSASVAVEVLSGGSLDEISIDVISPPGATDQVLSTQQRFTVRSRASASIDAQDVRATLTVPADFTPVGGTVLDLGKGEDGPLPDADFTLIGPNSAVLDTVVVTFTGTDINTNDDLIPLETRLPVEVVPRTRLTLSASVTARTVTIGTPFTVTATVANVANAADIDGTAELTITVPTGYSLQSGPATKPFTVGSPVSWIVVAALAPSGPDDVVITISTVPDDENNNQTALVTDGQETISMVTEGSAISVTDVTEAQGIRNAVVPAGATGIDLLAFEMEYTATDPDAADARVDTIAVTILGANGQPLGAGAVARTLSRVYVQLGPTAIYQATSISSNPVPISFTGPGAERIIAPGGTQTALVGVDVAGNPAVEELSVQVRGGGLIVRDVLSTLPLSVVDAATGQGLNGRLTSAPLVILGSDFEEYVHNYPNPFRAGSQVTKIAYFMNSPGGVSMKIYAISGELVYEEAVPGGDARTTAGPHELEWDGRNGQGEIVRNGIYVCVLNAGGNSATFRIAVAK